MAKRCPALRKDGTQCEAFIAAGRTTCAAHDPDTLASIQARRNAGPECPICGRHHYRWTICKAPVRDAEWHREQIRRHEQAIAKLAKLEVSEK
jgi:hypothetical protein